MKPLRRLDPDEIASEAEDLLGTRIEGGRRRLRPAEILLTALQAAQGLVQGLVGIEPTDDEQIELPDEEGR